MDVQQHTNSDPFPQPHVFERAMGDTELSYYLPSRADGVNDMCLYLGFCAPRLLFVSRRVLATWTVLLLRHPLLAARVIPPPSNGNPLDIEYSHTRFSYTAPSSPEDAIQRASASVELQKGVSKDEILDRFLNGKRLLSESRLSYLILTEGLPTTESDHAEYGIFICAPHFNADNASCHQLLNEFFTIIAGTVTDYVRTTTDLERLVRKEWQARWHSGSTAVLPPPLEDRLPPIRGLLRKATGKVDFLNSLRSQIGGHALPRAKGAKRKVAVQNITFDVLTSRTILQKCKSQGISISNALFALSSLAWSRTLVERGMEPNIELPIMMYTAINLRPYFLPFNSSYFIPALGFFNVVLPSFLPSRPCAGEQTTWKALGSTFWRRARSAKAQCVRTAKHPLFVSRAREMARKRSETAKAFAVEDDAKELGLTSPLRTPTSPGSIIQQSTTPSTALLGMSHLGNLDGFYMRENYPSIRFHSVIPVTRMRHGGLMLFVYTFMGKLTLDLVYDVDGFKDGIVETWWKDLLGGCDELLIGKPTSRL